MDNFADKYLYHVTDRATAAKILKNGLCPMIGQRSRLAGEEDERIYLTEKSSLPYWKQILGQATILQIDASGLETERMERFGYGQYAEWVYDKPIDPKWITRSTTQAYLTDAKHRELCLSFVDTISQISILFARYITFYDDDNTENKEWAMDCFDYCQDVCRTMQYVLPHLNFHLVSAKDLRTHLKIMGDGGCTLCDRYEPWLATADHPMRLWQLLGRHALKTKETVWLYNWLKETFPRRLRVDTGGWTG